MEVAEVCRFRLKFLCSSQQRIISFGRLLPRGYAARFRQNFRRRTPRRKWPLTDSVGRHCRRTVEPGDLLFLQPLLGQTCLLEDAEVFRFKLLSRCKL